MDNNDMDSIRFVDDNKSYRLALNEELLGFRERGVSFSVNGRDVQPEDGLVDMLLADTDCTYMRNYQFKGSKIVKIDFNRIKL